MLCCYFLLLAHVLSATACNLLVMLVLLLRTRHGICPEWSRQTNSPWWVKDLDGHSRLEKRHGGNQATNVTAYWSHLKHSIMFCILLHVILLLIYIYSPYCCIAVFKNCRIPYRRTRIALSVSPYRCFIGDMVAIIIAVNVVVWSSRPRILHWRLNWAATRATCTTCAGAAKLQGVGVPD